MKRTLKRIAAVVVALPLAVGVAGGTANASHSVTVPGCFGGGTSNTVICNLTVTIGVPLGAETYQTTVPVCAGTCQNVPVTLVRTKPGEPAVVCYKYTRLNGTTVSACYDVDTTDPWVELLGDLVQDLLALAGDAVDTYWPPVCRVVANAADDRDIYINCPD
ncbi:MAG TPA: hypothetical protein VNA20_05290 [Frankiaceae bacterium]|nr:hypothetical protein [Frankiaceae bacterium]